jgi:hypothetical protein
MANPYQGWLYFQDANGNLQEVVNHARTLGYVSQGDLTCGNVTISRDVCPSFYFDPCDDWADMEFTSPDDAGNPAPWWDHVAGSPTSRAYGFWITEWTGLDGGHHSRTVTARGVRGGGGVMGPLSSRHRVMKLNVRLFGADECALDELFRWFESMLLNLCDPCATVSAFVRTCCPPNPEDTPEYGIYSLDSVGLVDGPTYMGTIDGLGCVIRDVELTLAAGAPCLYSLPDSLATDDTFDVQTFDDCDLYTLIGVGNDCTTFADERLSYPMPDMNYGVVAPIIRIRNSSNVAGVPFTVKGFVDPSGFGPDPCLRTVVAEMEFDGLPPHSDFLIDAPRSRLLYRSPETQSVWIDGSPWLITSPSVSPGFPRFNCPGGWVSIEPLHLLGGTSGLTFTVETQMRVGCVG